MEENAKQIRNHYKKEVEKVIIVEEQPAPRPSVLIPIAEHRQAIRDLKTMNDTYWQRECTLAQKRGVIEGLRQSIEVIRRLGQHAGPSLALIEVMITDLQKDPDLVVKEENETSEEDVSDSIL